MGLVAEVLKAAELMPRVLAVAAGLAAGPPLAVRRIKQNLLDADRAASFSDALNSEAERHARTAMHPDAAEAGRAFVQKRAPRFEGTPPREPWMPSKL